VLQDPAGTARELIASMRRRKAFLVSDAPPGIAKKAGAEVASGLPAFDQVNEAKAQMEEEVIRAALDLAHWNRKKAAQILAVDYKALLYKMKKLDISSAAGTKSVGETAA
jgi:DNA-binding NtrC family response regulator